MSEQYTYMWLRYWGIPYYVGKASSMKRVVTKHTGKVGRCPSADRIIIQEWDTEEEAFEAEKLLIACYGRKDLGTGCLINRTDGGEGRAIGMAMPEGTKKKISESNKGRVSPMKGVTFSEEHKKAIGNSNSGRVFSPEHRKKLSEAKLLHYKNNPKGPCSEETRRKLSVANKGKPFSVEHIEKLRIINTGATGRKLSEETRENMRNSWTEERKRKQGEITRQRHKGRYVAS